MRAPDPRPFSTQAEFPDTEKAMIDILRHGGGKFYEYYAGPIYASLRKHFPECGPHTVEDWTQDFFNGFSLHLQEKLSKFDPKKACFRTWLRVCAKNYVVDQLRLRKIPIAQGLTIEKLAEASVMDGEEQFDALAKRYLDEAYDQYLKSLDPGKRAFATALFEAQWGKLEELGKQWGMSRSQVYSERRKLTENIAIILENTLKAKGEEDVYAAMKASFRR